MAKFKPQYRRMLFIDRKIREGRYPNCSSLAEEWEVSAKTIQRDIDYLKYDLDAPIEYDKVHHGYLYTEPNYRLPAITVTESDLFAVCIAERALKQFEHTPLYPKLVSIFEKIEQGLPTKTGIKPAWIDNRIHFVPEPATRINTEVWEIIAQGLRENRRLKIQYRTPGGRALTQRTVDPYHLVNFRGQWYLSSLCHKRDSIRTFAVSRICDVELLKEHFVMPEGFDREKMFGDTFGIIWNRDEHRVRIRFTRELAPYIEERTWHPHQRIKKNKDGSLVLEFKTRHLNEVKDWVLSWGPGARAMMPKQLVTQLKSDLKKTLSAY